VIVTVIPALTSEGCVPFEIAPDLTGVQDAPLLRVQHIQVGLVGSQTADLRANSVIERRVKIQTLDAFQGI